MMQAMPDIEKLISLGVMQLIESKIDIKELIVPEKQKKTNPDYSQSNKIPGRDATTMVQAF
jgi:hypothetical protein